MTDGLSLLVLWDCLGWCLGGSGVTAGVECGMHSGFLLFGLAIFGCLGYFFRIWVIVCGVAWLFIKCWLLCFCCGCIIGWFVSG